MKKLIFEGKNFDVIKKGNNYFGIERNGKEFTSADTYSKAIKRVKLMDRVYDLGYSQGCWDNY
ncbi:hypothetical protein H8J86_07950 [Clostridium perfringens]|uniref:hypothetical protein n=1 Tax=Clostridium perfringens TaxID=1502 RepID=UPI0018E4D68F|nr:hypothetical protein [Clostridium perfringens]MBI6005884.1 hypothetical protein [Clostridium perfringens]MDK0621548.1 hypothetical protein [Clostridium perfringens]